MPATQRIDADAKQEPPRRDDHHERFVAFAFAAADLVVEVASGGRISYAAGAFRSRFGRSPDECVGTPFERLVVPADREACKMGLAMLAERGRILPWVVRLANRNRTPMALAGLRLAEPGRPLRMCLTFSPLPAPLGEVNRAATAAELVRTAEDRIGTENAGALGLIEVQGFDGSDGLSDLVCGTMDTLLPDALTSEIAPGRFGCLPAASAADELLEIAVRLESALQDRGLRVAVSAGGLGLSTDGLSRHQASRALRHALSVFAREGAAGLGAVGKQVGLATYVQRAASRAGLLRRAIQDHRFDLVYQPIVSLSDGTMHHHEALLRPQPIPGCAFASPQEFVLLVEALGLTLELDLSVAETACRAAERGAAIAFNVSGQSMQCPTFRARLLTLLAASPACRAGRILIEMTETAEIDDVTEAATTVAAIRAAGVRFCVDDFGAGVADVRLVRALSPDIVKLDGSYVPALVREGRERAFVAGLVEIARAAGAEVVAERVETMEEAEVLRSLDVHYGQGWLFGRPAPLLPPPVVAGARRRGPSVEQWG